MSMGSPSSIKSQKFVQIVHQLRIFIENIHTRGCEILDQILESCSLQGLFPYSYFEDLSFERCPHDQYFRLCLHQRGSFRIVFVKYKTTGNNDENIKIRSIK